MNHAIRAAASLAILALCSPAPAEDFDRPGGLAATLFPEVFSSAASPFDVTPVDPGLGAPDTRPPLPVNLGGDFVLRCFGNGSLSSSASYALTANNAVNQLNDARITGVIAFGVTNSASPCRASLILRATTDGPFLSLNGYSAQITGTSSQASLSINRVSLGTTQTTLGTSQTFTFSPTTDNYRLTFTARRRLLSATLMRLRVVGGVIVEEPVRLTTTADPSTLAVIDRQYTSGRSGVAGQCVVPNTAFFDDVHVTPLRSTSCITFDGLANGTRWSGTGASTNVVPGQVVFTQNGVPVSVERFQYSATSTSFSAITVTTSSNYFNPGPSIMSGNMNLKLNLAASGAPLPRRVTLDVATFGGVENIGVNGAPLYFGPIRTAPATIAPGVRLTVLSAQPQSAQAQIVLDGVIRDVTIGGQEFELDNVCTEQACAADLDDGSGRGSPDGGVTLEDLLFYVDAFNRGSPDADLDDGSGTGQRDGGVTLEDLLYFVGAYGNGC